jgi:hypothetical protein
MQKDKKFAGSGTVFFEEMLSAFIPNALLWVRNPSFLWRRNPERFLGEKRASE